jgi:hypothetical protein
MGTPQDTSSGIAFRRTPRRAFNRSVGILCAGHYQVFQAMQLSEGGMLFKSEKPFQLTQQIVASLVLPGGGVVSARGEIIYQKPDTDSFQQYGVKFAPLSLNVRRWIRIFVSSKTQKEAELDLNTGISSFTEDILEQRSE